MKKPWANVALFEDENSAKVLEQFFRDKHLEARTYNDKLLQLLLFLCRPHMTFRVQVPGNFTHFAKEVLEKNPPAILDQAVHCPNCGSLQVNYPQMSRKGFIMPTVMLHLGILFRLVEHQCYCEECHWMWSLPKQRTAVSNVNSAEALPHPRL